MFFSIDLDADEGVIKYFCYFWIFKGLLFHHVAPVTGSVTDRQEDGLLKVLCCFERFNAPRIPVNRVMGVLQQIGRLFVDQSICKLMGFLFHRLLEQRIWRNIGHYNSFLLFLLSPHLFCCFPSWGHYNYRAVSECAGMYNFWIFRYNLWGFLFWSFLRI